MSEPENNSPPEAKPKLTPTEENIGKGIACVGGGVVGVSRSMPSILWNNLLEILGAKSKDGSIKKTIPKIVETAKSDCVAGKEIIDAHPEIVIKTEDTLKEGGKMAWEGAKALGRGALEMLKEYQKSQANNVPYCNEPNQQNCKQR